VSEFGLGGLDDKLGFGLGEPKFGQNGVSFRDTAPISLAAAASLALYSSRALSIASGSLALYYSRVFSMASCTCSCVAMMRRLMCFLSQGSPI
jgi:hypothetical protein